MEPNETYKWQVELTDSTVINRDDVAKDKSLWENLDFNLICKVTLVPQSAILPIHHVLINKHLGEKFVKRFGRGYKKQTPEGFKLLEYAHCVATNKYRFTFTSVINLSYTLIYFV